MSDMPNTAAGSSRDEMQFSGHIRAATLAGLAREPLDLLVIGGGINGAGIAREAALRGLKVGLVDKGDFASGTSSRSSKLIHGGFRYLELGDFRLVFESCQERDLLRRTLAPHLVRPMPFVFPVYRRDPRSLIAIRAGLWLYDLLATFRNIKRHRYLSPRATANLEPNLRRRGLRGAGFYYDCWTDDARLTLETVLSAWLEGALVCNYVAVTAFRRTDGRIDGVRLHDVLRNETVEARATVVVNAAGPWADAVRALENPAARPLLRLTKGTHIIIPRRRIGNRHAVVLRGPRDARIMFVIPWGEAALVGTTDTDFSGTPDEVRPDQADVEYLLEAVNDYFPDARVTFDDVVSAYAGLRPLVDPSDGANGDSPSAVSREEAIDVSPSGLVTLVGGKITTYRRVAIAVVETVVAELRRRGDQREFPKSRSDRKPLPGAGDHGAADAASPSGNGVGHLTARYGSRMAALLQLVDAASTGGADRLGEPLAPPAQDLRGEVRIAAAAEMAVRIEDVLRRRLHVALKNPSQGIDVLHDVVAEMAEILGWDQEQRAAEEAAYRSQVMEERRSWARS